MCLDSLVHPKMCFTVVTTVLKLELHGTDTDTDTDKDILANSRARMLACLATSPFSLARVGHAR